MSQPEVIIAAAARTAIGTFGGSFKTISPADLGSFITKAVVERAGIDAESVQANIVGHVLRTEIRDAYMARRIALGADLPVSTQSLTVNRLCGSGLEAIVLATQQIQLGDVDVAVAGGAESMSKAAHLVTTNRWGQPMGECVMQDELTGGLTDPFGHGHMGITAENLATKYDISREQQDAFALQSQQRAANAIEKGYFKEQIVPFEIKTRKGVQVFDTDEHVRGTTSAETLAKLRPAFKADGSVTAGNASGINDGAAMVVLMSGDAAKQQNVTPMGKMIAYGRCGVSPDIMGIGPVGAVKTALSRAGLTIADMDVIESNEAFAAQALAVQMNLELPADKTNPNGGAIALGHPIGASGAVVFTKALYELHRTGGRYGLITLCIGGGQGISAIIERV